MTVAGGVCHLTLTAAAYCQVLDGRDYETVEHVDCYNAHTRTHTLAHSLTHSLTHFLTHSLALAISLPHAKNTGKLARLMRERCRLEHCRRSARARALAWNVRPRCSHHAWKACCSGRQSARAARMGVERERERERVRWRTKARWQQAAERRTLGKLRMTKK